ncbi:MAG TPA: T9SS type A sorting domain-containing protein [Flavobacteriaceae bacterium]|nr:T9SS type A sorting domain-containing protein [Flavobacteriaceae bacterium]
MKTYIIFISFFIGIISSNAQTTAIPDVNFEQELINQGIDSDGTINGQVLTSDIVGVLHLDLNWVYDLTGLQDFAALESLKLEDGGGPNITLDLTANINLKKLEIWSFVGLSTLDLTGLTSLEELILLESQGDVMTMPIDSLDLSTNTNIDKLYLADFFIQTINLQNGNNANMLNFELDLVQGGGPGPPSPPTDRAMCIKVDDAVAATANTAPYDSWIIDGIAPTFYDSGVCTLSVNDVETVDLVLYPNPAIETFQINSQQNIKKIHIYDLYGKLVKNYTLQENYPVGDLTKGIYMLEIQTFDGQKQVLKFVKK